MKVAKVSQVQKHTDRSVKPQHSRDCWTLRAKIKIEIFISQCPLDFASRYLPVIEEFLGREVDFQKGSSELWVIVQLTRLPSIEFC